MLIGSGVDLPVLLCEICAVPGAVQLLWSIPQLNSDSVSSRLLLLPISRITTSVPAPPPNIKSIDEGLVTLSA